ncbi:restriction endonuclease subunit S [Streptococcus sp. k-628]|uniref:restriction endonuclease subunit S n=1 Tax=Streptococcus TaxID=1301 RepID=UPI001F050435|nr:restriction endonuclease subunit S [Streptococcus sp. k-628]
MTKKPSYRFVRYTEAWEQRKLGEVAQYRNGKAHENCIDENGKYIVVNSKFISTDGEVKKFSNKKNEALFENEIAFVLSDVPNGRAIARTFWVEKNDKYTLNQRIAGITPIGETFPYFLYILMNRHPYFLAFDDGAKQTNLSVSDVMGFEAYYPKYSEQQKIGAYFRNLDHLITLQQRKLEVLKEQKKTYLKLLFPAKGQTKPALRFAGFEDDWKEVKLGETETLFTDGNYGEAYPSEKDLTTSENGVPFLRGSNLVNGVLDETNANYITHEKHEELTSGHIELDDIILAVRGSLGAIGYAKDENVGWNINSQLAIIRTNKNEAKGDFLLQFFISTKGQRELLSRNTGTALKQLPLKQLKDIPVPLPSLPEQEAIGSFFQGLDKSIAKQEEKVNQLKESKQTLLRKMFI